MIVVVITAYKPDSGFFPRFEPLLSVASSIIVSNNTPGDVLELPPFKGFTIINNLENLGLGRALNIGIERALSLGANYIVFFDQDSTPSSDFVQGLIDRLKGAISVYGLSCCVGPTHIDDCSRNVPRKSGANLPYRPLSNCFEEVTCLPTSGMAFSTAMLTLADRFCEDFFLDLVDFEWCWRLGTVGWRFLRAPDLYMLHRLGESERVLLGITFHVPAPYRHYFQVRDTLKLMFRVYVPLYSKLRLISVLPLKILAYPLILNCGLERLAWMFRGLRDYLRGINGIGSARKRLSR